MLRSNGAYHGHDLPMADESQTCRPLRQEFFELWPGEEIEVPGTCEFCGHRPEVQRTYRYEDV